MTALTPQERLLELAERVEKATGPDRELDALIACAINPEIVPYPRERGWIWSGVVDCNAKSARTYTASLDAAMTLVPTHAGIGLSGPHAGGWLCTFEAGRWGKDDDDAKFSATPALAITAAALRARASIPDAAEGRE